MTPCSLITSIVTSQLSSLSQLYNQLNQPPDELPPLPHAVELPPITKKPQDSDP